MAGLAAGLALSGCLATGPVHERFEGPYIAAVEPPAPRETAVYRRTFDGPVSPDTLTQLSSGGWSIMDLPRLEAYAEGVLDDLLDVWRARHPDAPVPKIRVFFTSGSHFHASATKDAEIFVALGALERMGSEDELAFLLGHEAAHILLRHHDRQDNFSAFDDALNHATALGALALAASDMEIRRTGDSVSVTQGGDPEVRQMATKGLVAYLTLRELTGTVLSPAWSRDQEEYADLLGLDLMVAAGYDPREVINLFGKRADDQRVRLAELRADAERRSAEYEAAMNAAFAEEGLAGVMAAGIDAIASAGLDAVGQMRRDIGASHPDWEARRDAARLYTLTRHGDAVAADPPTRTGPYRAALSAQPTASVIANHRAAHDALVALEAERIAGAERLGLQGISWPTSDAPFPRYALYMVRKYQGNVASARANLDRIRLDHRAPAVIYTSLASEYLVVDRPGQALDVLRKGADSFGFREPFLPEFILAHARNGSMANAEAAWSECRQSEDGDLRKRCRQKWREVTATDEDGQAAGDASGAPGGFLDSLLPSS
ncbi:MAG: M48 family metalloprotease [Azospirillaceae bacterium]